MALYWTDSLELALALDATYPTVDPRTVNFVDLRAWIIALPEFADVPARCGEKILEAVQAAWIDERD